MNAASGDPVLDWLRQKGPIVEYRGSEPMATLGDDPSRAVDATVEVVHRRHRDHPTWEIPSIPGDLFPLRAAAMVGHGAQHRPICAVVRALRPGESARVRSDHPVGPLCHALADGCTAEVEWRLEEDGPDAWTLLLTRR